MAFRKQQPRLRFEDSIRQVLRASGSPIDAAIRVPLEKRFGRDFGRVRVHADDLAARSARRLGARAYTAGSHIVFAQGRYDPRTREGLWLLSHELAHVVQQDAVLPTSLTLGGARDPLEHAADRAADLVAAGRCLPPGFAFGAAPAGTVQRHVDEPCPGIVIRPYEPGNPGIGGNSALEIAYKQAFEDRVDSCFFGSQYDKERPGVDVFFPKGAPHSVIRNRILTRLRGLVYQRRPDIIDFQERVIYEIKTPDYANDGMVQLESYYRIANEVIAEHARSMGSGRRLTPTDEERPFDRSKARWYPPHVLAYPGDWKAIVCTQATDHATYPGLILYDIRKRARRRPDAEDRRVTVFDTVRIDNDFAGIGPQVVNEAKKQIRFYDENEPRYVIIIPREIYKKWPHQQNELWDKLRVTPSYGDAPGASYVRHVKTQLAVVAAIVSVVGIAVLIVVASATIIFAISAAAAVAAETAAVAGTVAEADVIPLAAYRAAKAAPAVKALAKAAGVLFVLGTVNNADADNPTVTAVDAIRVVAVGDFELFGTPTAGSGPDAPVSPTLHSPEATRGKFELGSIVIYDHAEHIVIGQIGVR